MLDDLQVAPDATPTNPTEPTAPVDDPKATQPPVEGVPPEGAPADEGEPAPAIAPYRQQDVEEARQREAWLQRNLSTLQEDLNTTRQRLRDYELAGLEPDEQQNYLLQEKENELAKREQNIQQQQAALEWYQYFQGWGVPSEQITGNGPAEWNHSILTYFKRHTDELNTANQKLAQELRAYKETANPSVPVEPTTTGGGSPAQRPTLYEMSWEELQEIHNKAQHGLMNIDDYPPVPKED